MSLIAIFFCLVAAFAVVSHQYRWTGKSCLRHVRVFCVMQMMGSACASALLLTLSAFLFVCGDDPLVCMGPGGGKRD